MRVLDHELHAWFLLQDGDTLLLDTNCSHSFVGYTYLIALTHDEAARFKAEGRSYLDMLSRDIQHSAPILRDSRSPYKGRDLSNILGDRVLEAIKAWRAEGAA